MALAACSALAALGLTVSSALAAGAFLPGGLLATRLVSFLATGALGVRAGAAFLTGVDLAGAAAFLPAAPFLAFLAFLAGGAAFLAGGAERFAGADLLLVALPFFWEAAALAAGLFCGPLVY